MALAPSCPCLGPVQFQEQGIYFHLVQSILIQEGRCDNCIDVFHA